MATKAAQGTTGDTALTAAAAATGWIDIPQGGEARVHVRGSTWTATVQLRSRRNSSQSTPDVIESYSTAGSTDNHKVFAPGAACQAQLYVSAFTSQTDLSGEIVTG